MGQEQSAATLASAAESAQEPAGASPAAATNGGADAQSSATATPATGRDDGIHLVQGTGTGIQTDEVSRATEEILDRSSKQPVPQPLLPRPSVDDSISSGLQGARMMQELRTLFDGLAVTVDETSSSLSNSLVRSSTKLLSSASPQNLGTSLLDQLASSFNSNANATETEEKEKEREKELEKEKEVKEEEERQRKEKEKETQVLKLIGIDPVIMDKVLEDCTGGERMSQLVERQRILVQRIHDMLALGMRLKSAAQLNTEQARQTTRAIEVLDRLSLSISDLTESVENVVATSNILGAAHFADDDEMSSFKNFLRRNPP